MHELARELGVDSKTILAKLKEMGEFVKSASSIVEEPVAYKIRAAFTGQGRRPTPAPAAGFGPPPAIKRSNVGRHMRPLDEVFRDPDVANTARSLGLSGIPARRGPYVPLTGTAARIRERFPQIRDDDTARDLAFRWTNAMVDEAEAITWWDAGLGPDDHATVWALKDHGISPQHLREVIDGQRVGALLRGGKTVSYLAGLLRTHGHIS